MDTLDWQPQPPSPNGTGIHSLSTSTQKDLAKLPNSLRNATTPRPADSPLNPNVTGSAAPHKGSAHLPNALRNATTPRPADSTFNPNATGISLSFLPHTPRPAGSPLNPNDTSISPHSPHKGSAKLLIGNAITPRPADSTLGEGIRPNLPVEAEANCFVPDEPIALDMMQTVNSATASSFCPSSSNQVVVVMVTETPFGMNIQVKEKPCVLDISPGSPAEVAGVEKGFVLRSVGGVEVTNADWYRIYGAAKAPFPVTFETTVLRETTADLALMGDPFGDAFEDFRCQVMKVPFGVKICQGGRTWARVIGLQPGGPAQQAGVLEGDILIAINGQSVRADTWFAVMQYMSVLPYEMHFRRPVARFRESTWK